MISRPVTIDRNIAVMSAHVDTVTLLVVEDNKGDEILLTRALTAAGIACNIEYVRDGQQAVDRLLNQ
jgi:hypothetical protein